MHFQELHTSVLRYFGDMSRPVAETRSALLALAAECQSLAGTLSVDEGGAHAAHDPSRIAGPHPPLPNRATRAVSDMYRNEHRGTLHHEFRVPGA